MTAATDDLDPRWAWIDVSTHGEPDLWAKGGCKHLADGVVTVHSGGEIVAYLCTTCDTQLPAEWRP